MPKKKKNKKDGYLKRRNRFSKKLKDQNINGIIIDNPPGRRKMSEIILEFVEPYFHLPHPIKSIEDLLDMASLAWNMAILPEEAKDLLLEGFLEEHILSDSELKEKMKLVDELVERKKKHFHQYKRLFRDYQLTYINDNDWNISILSEFPRSDVE
ncbi:hypothetical protein GF312_19400 [Candidatus Poribacteria bacterium]|nr:hypothetical protein [Candidatus Poribacteria bacterium]